MSWIVGEREDDRALVARPRPGRGLPRLGLPKASGSASEFGRVLEEALADADTDEVLAQAMAATRRVVVPYFFVFPPHDPCPSTTRPSAS